MKAASAKEIKQELMARSPKELLNLCLRLSRFKKENKELLTYLLFEVEDEEGYIRSVKITIDETFDQININRYYYVRKSLMKILRMIKKYSRYSLKKETEVELLLYFCSKLMELDPYIRRNRSFKNFYDRQIIKIEKTIPSLHEDLQYDYGLKLEDLKINR